MNINLVTGGAGFIGSNLINLLLSKGEKVICLDNFSTGSKDNIMNFHEFDNFEFMETNILNPIDIKVDKIWHFACPASPRYYYKNSIETTRICFLGTYNILELARKNKCKLLFASSSEVYGNSEKVEQKESYFGNVDTQCIRSSYAEGKRVAENLCFQYQKIYDLEIKIARIFNTYGPKIHLKDGRVISSFFYSIFKKKPFEIFGDGSQTRSFCYISDLIKALCLFMDTNKCGIMNLGNNEEIKIIELAKLINLITNNSNDFIFKNFNENEPMRRKPSIELAKKELNWNPKIKLIEGLKLTYNSFSKMN